MTDNELLLLIAFVTTITTLIQCIEMWILVHNQRETNRILSQPGDIIKNLIIQLQEDKDFQQNFWGLIQACGASIIQGIRGGGGELPKPVKLKGFARIFEPFVNNPDIQSMVADGIQRRLGTVLEETGKKAAEKATEGW